MSRTARILALFLVFTYAVYCESPVQKTQLISGQISNNFIFQTTNDFTLNNIALPMQVSIYSANSSSTTVTLNTCFNSNYNLRVVGTTLTNCPDGGFAQLTYTQSSGFTSKKYRTQKEGLSHHILRAIEDASSPVPIYGYPSTSYITGDSIFSSFSVSFSDESANFTLLLSYEECTDSKYPVGPNNTCIEIQDLTNEIMNNQNTQNFSIPPQSMTYYSFTANQISENNEITLTDPSGRNVYYLQQNYYPTTTWNIADASAPISISTPGRLNSGQTYFFAIPNNGESYLNGSFIIQVTSCNDSHLFGYNCQVNSSSTNSAPLNQINNIPVTITTNTSLQDSTTNNGTAWSFSQYSDSTYDNQYLYFRLTDLPIYPANSSYVRISTADNNGETAPNIFAKIDGYPSSTSFDYSSLSSSVVNQLVLPFDQTDTWYIAVALPADFSIWVGPNCANNCSNQEHGSCLCSIDGALQNCYAAATNQIENLYLFPTMLGDSTGVCECSDSNYGGYQCDEIQSYEPVIITLIVVIVTSIVLIIIIAVPTYFLLKYKKKRSYEQL